MSSDDNMCPICYTEKTTFMDCDECKKRICTSCFRQLPRLKCPLCRTSYVNEESIPRDLWADFEELEQTDIPESSPILFRDQQFSIFDSNDSDILSIFDSLNFNIPLADYINDGSDGSLPRQVSGFEPPPTSPTGVSQWVQYAQGLRRPLDEFRDSIITHRCSLLRDYILKYFNSEIELFELMDILNYYYNIIS